MENEINSVVTATTSTSNGNENTKNKFEYILLNNDFELKIRNIGNPKVLIISGIFVILLGSISVYQILSAGPFVWWLIALLLVTLVFLNSYANYEQRVAINSPKVEDISFKILDDCLTSSIKYFIAFDKKGPRLATTKFKYKNISLITYNISKKTLTIISKYSTLIEFDNPNYDDILNNYEDSSTSKTIEYKIDFNGDYSMINLLKEKSNIPIEIF